MRSIQRALDAAERRATRAWRAHDARERVGLSTVHSSARDTFGVVRTAMGGSCTMLRRVVYATPQPGSRPTRGVIREFSRRSRTRLQQMICSVPVDHVGRGILFITLTYPEAYPGDWRVWKSQLDNVLERMKRRFPRACGFWKLEPQQRGAPHYHLLVMGVPFIAKEWLSRAWYEVVKSGDVKHLSAGTQVELARSHRGVVSYAAKYTAKALRLPPDWRGGVGRYWGAFNRDAIGIVYAQAPITRASWQVFARACRGLVRSRTRGGKGRKRGRSADGGLWLPMRDGPAARLYAWALQSVTAP